MSLNNIILPPQLLADLYPSSLVQNLASAVPAKLAMPFLGKNEKNILIVANKKDVPFLSDKELQFLTQVLSACQLGLPHVAIVNWASLPKKNSAILLDQFGPKEVLLLDVEPAVFDFPHTPAYTVRQHQNVSFVTAPSLQTIEGAKEEKKKLWTALKQLFCI